MSKLADGLSLSQPHRARAERGRQSRPCSEGVTLTRSQSTRDNPAEHKDVAMSSKSHALASGQHHTATWRIVVGYTISIIVFVGLIALVLSYGDRLTATGEEVKNAAAATAVHKYSILYHVLLALV